MCGQLEGAGRKLHLTCCLKMHKDNLTDCTGDSPKQAGGVVMAKNSVLLCFRKSLGGIYQDTPE